MKKNTVPIVGIIDNSVLANEIILIHKNFIIGLRSRELARRSLKKKGDKKR